MSYLRTFVSSLLTVCLCAQFAVACPNRDPAIAAIDAGNFALAVGLQERIAVDPACDDAFRLWLDEGVARLAFQAGQAAADPAEQARLYTQSLNAFAHWRTYVALADVAKATGDRTTEARNLQLALNQLNEGPARHSATEAEVRRVFDRAVGAVALADGVVEAPRTRSGKLGGIFNTQVRGFVFEELPYPIEYEFDSFQMTQRGLQNAEVMLEHLLSNQPASIVLEGHTDPTGEANYNLTLSLQRAQAAQTFFEDGGFVGVVSVEGRGESMRIDPDLHNVAFDSAEHHQLERRVVLIRE